MKTINLNEYASGDVLAMAALEFAAARVQAAFRYAERLGDDGASRVTERARRRVALRAIESAQSQLTAAAAILNSNAEG